MEITGLPQSRADNVQNYLATVGDNIPRFTTSWFVVSAREKLLVTNPTLEKRSAMLALVSMGGFIPTFKDVLFDWSNLFKGPIASAFDRNGDVNRTKETIPRQMDSLRFLTNFDYFTDLFSIYGKNPSLIADRDLRLDRHTSMSEFVRSMRLANEIEEPSGRRIFNLTRGTRYLFNLINKMGGVSGMNDEERDAQRISGYVLNRYYEGVNSLRREKTIATDFNATASKYIFPLETTHEKVTHIRMQSNCLDSLGNMETEFIPEAAGIDPKITKRYCLRCKLLAQCGNITYNVHRYQTSDIPRKMMQATIQPILNEFQLATRAE